MILALILIGGLLNFFLGVAVFLNSPKEKQNRYFALICLTTTGLILVDAYFRFNPTVAVLRTAFAIAALIPVSLFIWTTEFLGLAWSGLKKFIFSVPAIVLFFFCYVDSFIVVQVDELLEFGYRGTLGPFFGFYTSVLTGYVLLSVFLLYEKYKKTEDIVLRQQIKYVAFGIGAYSATAFFFSLILPSFFDFYSLTLLDAPSSVLFVIFTAYAILKHHLFSLKVLATELFSLALILTQFGRVFLETERFWVIMEVGLFGIVLAFAILLIRSVLQEVDQREKIEKLAKELEVANEKLRELDQQKSEFVSIASHQLRSPLTAIKGYTSMLLEGSYGEINEKVRTTLERVFQSGQTLVVVIENFLNLSRIEQGRMAYTMAPVDLRVLIRQVVDQLSPNASKKGLNLSYDFHPTEEPESTSLFTLTVDGEKIRQVLLNLLDNSIKYTPNGTVRVLLEKGKTKGVRLTISDTGIGMSKKTIDKLFKKFSRADGAGKVNAGGSGLGLYLAGEIMKAHNGKVWAESEGEGKGSSFIIELGTE